MIYRYRNALEIVNVGASNPSGICHAIIEACQEIRDNPNHTGTAEIYNDPAIKLMVTQLSSLVGNGEMDYDDYVHCKERCQHAIENNTKEVE
jgi:hypothetical protein